MNNPTVGEYVTYKNSSYIVVRVSGDLLLLLSPDNKVQVSKFKCVPLNIRAMTSYYDMRNYLVTKKGLIISVKTGKIMKWQPCNVEYKGIMANITAC